MQKIMKGGMRMKVLNLTQHPLYLYDMKDSFKSPILRKFVLKDDNCKPIKTIPSYKTCSVNMKTRAFSYIEGIPVFDNEIFSLDPLPESDDPFTIYIVSSYYAQAYYTLYPHDEKTQIYTVSGVIYTSDGRKNIGIRGITKYRP